MSVTIGRDQAKEEARARLPELLADLIPNFRSDRAFRCLNPGHEDRHPSMRYLSRVNAVKCFSCGWTGDSFAVVGAIYGLTGGNAFKKTFEVLGIDTRGGHVRRQQPKQKPANTPIKNWSEIVALIYPPGWDTPKAEKLPQALEVTATVEAGVIGWLLDNPFDVLIAFQAGLRQEHFNDQELGKLFTKIMYFDDLHEYNDTFLTWAKTLAVPGHMLKHSAKFIAATGKRHLLDVMLAKAFTCYQNGDNLRWLLVAILKRASTITREQYTIPDVDDHHLDKLLFGLFERFYAGEQSENILSGFI